METMDYFLEIYGKVPRAGPGSSTCTQRAYRLMNDVAEHPRILDIGCGPGVQTVDLLKISGGSVVALDFLPQMLARTRANAERAGVMHRLQLLEQDMRQMTFPPASFDVIWSEAAIYNLGFANGLQTVRQWVRPGGHVAVSEAVWLRPDPPQALKTFWEQYPEIDSIENKLAVIERQGYTLEGHFVLPDSAWLVDYFDPIESLLAEKSRAWAGIPEALAVIDEARQEIDVFRQYSPYFGYAFFVMQRPAE